MSRGRELAAVPATAPLEPVDPRAGQMRCLVEPGVLGEEWDAGRQLLTPRPGGRLTRVPPCQVAGCRNVRHGAKLPCHAHLRAFGRCGLPDVETWLASGPGTPARQRWVSEEECTVGGDAGGCPRPGAGGRGLCHAHDVAWAAQHRAGKDLAGFLASATPLPGFGGCVAASCYLAAAHAKTRLCEIHYRIWRDDGSPAGQRFPVWAAGVRQPANGRVLSLRGLPELVRLELLYAVGCRVQAQIRTGTGNMRGYVDRLRSAGVTSVLDYDLRCLDADGNHDYGRFARFTTDRVRLAYADAEAERGKDTWDLRVFGRSGHLDFAPIRQDWLREVARAWAGAALVRVRSKSELQHRVQSVAVLSRVLASGPGGGADPTALGRADAERFLLRVRSAKASTGRPYSPRRAAGIVEDVGFVIREARDLGLLADLGPTFAFRRRDGGPRVAGDELGKALPAHVVAALDAELDRLRAVPGSAGGPSHHGLGVLTERAGETAVLAYLLLKGTGRRVGEVASLHLDCLGLDEHAKPVLVYDNHKAARMGRQLPLADTALVETIRSQQAWVTGRFPGTPREALWLLPRANKNADGRAHLPAHQILMWMRSWVAGIPRLDAGGTGQDGEPIPFDRRAVHPHAFRHTYAQSLADSGVAPSVLRDLMDHRSLSTTLGYYRVGEARKRAAMELLARHTIDNRGTARPVQGPASRAGQLREELSWVAVPMGKCAEPANVRAGGGACPIRYQCAACPHFESDPSFLPELRGYADDLRREREAMLAAGAADWVVANITRQLDVITSHIHTHQGALDRLPGEQRAMIEEASATVRHVRRAVPVAFGPTRRRDQQ